MFRTSCFRHQEEHLYTQLCMVRCYAEITIKGYIKYRYENKIWRFFSIFKENKDIRVLEI